MTTGTLERTQQSAVEPKKTYTVRDLLMDKRGDLMAALPKHIAPDYFMRVVLTAVQRNPKLAQCDPLSFLGAVLQCAQLGLAPDPFLGQAYIIPYENKRRKDKQGNWGVLEAQFQPGYKGLVALARRSGEITTIHAEVVYQKDKFTRTYGLNPSVSHEKFEGDGDAGPLTHVYAFYKLRDGSYDLAVMNKREIDKIRARSQAYQAGQRDPKKRDSPWYTDEEAMWKKTAIKQLMKLAPLSIEIQRVNALDDMNEIGLPQDLRLLADENQEPTPIDGEEIPPDDDDIEMPQRTSTAEATDAPPAAVNALPDNADRIVETSTDRGVVIGTTERGEKFYTHAKGIAADKDALLTLRWAGPEVDWNGRRQLVKAEPFKA